MKKTNEHELKELLDKLSEKESNEEIKETDAQSQKKEVSDKDAEFEKLIKGEFKEQFEQRMMNNLKRRFKESSSLKAKAARNEEIINLLMAKYGIGDENSDELIKAIHSDNAPEKTDLPQSGAESDTLRRIRQLEYENKMIKNQMQKEKEEMLMRKTIEGWMTDGEKLKESYPDFDIDAETQNPAFINLLRGGADLKSAYFAMHHDEIVKALVEKAAQEAQSKTAESIIARQQRPLENGMSGKSTALFKTDVSRLTPEQRAEIAKRVARGEQISF